MRKILKIACIMLTVVLAVSTFGVTDVSAKSKKADPNKLAAPSISVKTSGRFDVTVKWSNVTGAEYYQLYSSTKKKRGYKLIASGTTATTSYYSDTCAGKRYYFKVKETGSINGVAKDGNFSKAKIVKVKKAGKGNAKKYALGKVKYNGTLAGKRIVFVGSSFTVGSKAKGVSFVNYLSKSTGCSVVKNAIGGTTTANIGDGRDFVRRSVDIINSTDRPDLFLCQMSANDATRGVPIGEITPEGTPMEQFNTSTVAGAMEYIICYSDQKWGCPIAFYTAMNLSNDRYDQMVSLMYKIQAKWGVGIIDLYHGLGRYSIKAKTYRLYMKDRLHPMKAGYMKWVTPYFEARIPGLLSMPDRKVEPEPIEPEPVEPVEPLDPIENLESQVEQPVDIDTSTIDGDDNIE